MFSPTETVARELSGNVFLLPTHYTCGLIGGPRNEGRVRKASVPSDWSRRSTGRRGVGTDGTRTERLVLW